MSEFRLLYTLDGIYWSSGDRRRKITSGQAIRLLNLLWQKAGYECEAITVIRRADGHKERLK